MCSSDLAKLHRMPSSKLGSWKSGRSAPRTHREALDDMDLETHSSPWDAKPAYRRRHDLAHGHAGKDEETSHRATGCSDSFTLEGHHERRARPRLERRSHLADRLSHEERMAEKPETSRRRGLPDRKASICMLRRIVSGRQDSRESAGVCTSEDVLNPTEGGAGPIRSHMPMHAMPSEMGLVRSRFERRSHLGDTFECRDIARERPETSRRRRGERFDILRGIMAENNLPKDESLPPPSASESRRGSSASRRGSVDPQELQRPQLRSKQRTRKNSVMGNVCNRFMSMLRNAAADELTSAMGSQPNRLSQGPSQQCRPGDRPRQSQDACSGRQSQYACGGQQSQYACGESVATSGSRRGSESVATICGRRGSESFSTTIGDRRGRRSVATTHTPPPTLPTHTGITAIGDRPALSRARTIPIPPLRDSDRGLNHRKGSV